MNWQSSLLILAALTPLFAQAQKRVGVSVAERSEDVSVEAQLQSFQIADGYEINLWASEEMGIANPIAIRWDPAGRLWVLTTLTYAQVEPGGGTNDKLIILEDTDRDGVADKSSVWADGLNMPTGFAIGHGGVYMGEGENLVFLKDTDDDGKADSKEVILSGFGTGDTHQNINSLSWGPAGDLWFAQGLHNLSRVETPWGIVRGEEAGFFRLRVKELRLEPFCMHSMMAQNPWGMTWDRWGAMLVKSNNTEIGFASPGIIPTDRYRELMRFGALGATPGKSMGCEIVESSHLPDELQNNVLIAGYFANRVTATPLVEEGSGFKRMPTTDLVVSSHTSFRPVEVKIGPDGAIYVAGWFNPIIGHYQASLRHPDRDRSHGRIWRITAKGRPLNEVKNLTSLDSAKLLTSLASPNAWNRRQAKRLLIDNPPAQSFFENGPLELSLDLAAQVMIELAQLVEGLGGADATWVELTLSMPDEPRVRAYGARMVGRWHDRLENPLNYLETAIADDHPRVRLEAVVSASHLHSAEAMKIALRALDQPVDKFIDYSLSQCVHALADHWLPAVQSGSLTFDKPEHLAYAVRNYGGADAANLVQQLLETAPKETKRELLLTLAQVGDASALQTAIEELPTDVEILQAVHQAGIARKIRPTGDSAKQLEHAMSSDDPAVLAAAIHLAGVWKVTAFADRIREL
ncbi:MAG: PVC-type heme-binding CxxCH protein, partial [Verrucomicrobiota bacterium]